MSRRKKPEEETAEEAKERLVLERVANFATRSEKTSWNRKMDNMVKLLSKLPAIEDRILEIISKDKQPLIDEIAKLRQSMVSECVHPFEQLVVHQGFVTCKFCNRKMAIQDNGTGKEKV